MVEPRCGRCIKMFFALIEGHVVILTHIFGTFISGGVFKGNSCHKTEANARRMPTFMYRLYAAASVWALPVKFCKYIV